MWWTLTVYTAHRLMTRTWVVGLGRAFVNNYSIKRGTRAGVDKQRTAAPPQRVLMLKERRARRPLVDVTCGSFSL